jgi:hypothetical protein
MFIAHLPAGYLTARAVMQRAGPRSGLLLAGMAGGVFPDVDLLYGALVDAGQIHHHRYWTHLPVFWLVVWVGLEGVARFTGRRFCHLHLPVRSFLLAVAGHLLLDTVAGDIWWFGPWLDQPFSLVTVPARYPSWWLSYLFHWTFALEMSIVALAGWVAWSAQRVRRAP